MHFNCWKKSALACIGAPYFDFCNTSNIWEVPIRFSVLQCTWTEQTNRIPTEAVADPWIDRHSEVRSGTRREWASLVFLEHLSKSSMNISKIWWWSRCTYLTYEVKICCHIWYLWTSLPIPGQNLADNSYLICSWDNRSSRRTSSVTMLGVAKY